VGTSRSNEKWGKNRRREARTQFFQGGSALGALMGGLV
jgi:hypothetical protein